MGILRYAGGNPNMTKPINGILANTLAVGSSVYLMENGTATEYLVIHQGLPSVIYDESCNGTWLLRKDCYEERQWDSSNVNDYANSTIRVYLNGDFFSLFSSIEQSAIKQVKIPYRAGRGPSKTVTSGASGLSSKIFLLSATETGFTDNFMPTDEGNVLSYFPVSVTSEKRIAYLNGSAIEWWLRSPLCNSTFTMYSRSINTDIGQYNGPTCNSYYGIRPALILPSNALFDKNTLILKGVA